MPVFGEGGRIDKLMAGDGTYVCIVLSFVLDPYILAVLLIYFRILGLM